MKMESELKKYKVYGFLSIIFFLFSSVSVYWIYNSIGFDEKNIAKLENVSTEIIELNKTKYQLELKKFELENSFNELEDLYGQIETQYTTLINDNGETSKQISIFKENIAEVENQIIILEDDISQLEAQLK